VGNRLAKLAEMMIVVEDDVDVDQVQVDTANMTTYWSESILRVF